MDRLCCVAGLVERRRRRPIQKSRGLARAREIEEDRPIPLHPYRFQIVLAASEGVTNRAIAAKFRMRPASIGDLLKRFSQRGIPALYDRPRTGRRSTVSPDQTQRVLRLHLSGERYTQEQIAKLVGISRYQVFHILREYRRERLRLGRKPNS